MQGPTEKADAQRKALPASQAMKALPAAKEAAAPLISFVSREAARFSADSPSSQQPAGASSQAFEGVPPSAVATEWVEAERRVQDAVKEKVLQRIEKQRASVSSFLAPLPASLDDEDPATVASRDDDDAAERTLRERVKERVLRRLERQRSSEAGATAGSGDNGEEEGSDAAAAPPSLAKRLARAAVRAAGVLPGEAEASGEAEDGEEPQLQGRTAALRQRAAGLLESAVAAKRAAAPAVVADAAPAAALEGCQPDIDGVVRAWQCRGRITGRTERLARADPAAAATAGTMEPVSGAAGSQEAFE